MQRFHTVRIQLAAVHTALAGHLTSHWTACAVPAADLPGYICLHGSTVAQLPGQLPRQQPLFPAELASGPQQPLALALPVERLPPLQQ